jgi:hypothetical protein
LNVRWLRRLHRRDPFPSWDEFAIRLRVLPEPERDWKRVDVELLPPRGRVAKTMKLAVMDPTNRDGELVADSVTERTRLQ